MLDNPATSINRESEKRKRQWNNNSRANW